MRFRMLSLIIRNLFFTALHPGLIAGLFPYWILGGKVNLIFFRPLELVGYIAIIIFCVGLVVLVTCITRFAVEGRGTLSPADPTRHLVRKGLYKYSRNPMYLGVLLILIGESIFFHSPQLWL